ncbi:mediator of DNA damage checkpoint protein 1 [Nematolebias whitei]|uniref:mediator of DNA damage checkpoint protein 1 n=1 Tax=Nematolebias whitei TaxID=451745 RepID=UPI00189A055E|nr:mediator of DNA damage checkpoint protein 1 [Nematolebias whitei]
MDVRLRANSQLQYQVNGGACQTSRLVEDTTLHFLSREEKECLQFFEDTIESLEESLEVDNPRPGHVTLPESSTRSVNHVDGLPVLSANRRVNVSSHQDIIDLVHQQPDVHNQEPIFNPTNPDFQHMLQAPESHFEVKPTRESLPSDYDPPLPSGSYGSPDGHSSYHPPGCVPTPVLIAQKIAENKGEGTTNLRPSTLLRRLSSESSRPNVHVKLAPHTSAKHSRYPSNINVLHSNKEQQRPVVNVSIPERQEQMLSNLSGPSYPVVPDNSQQFTEQTDRNTPARRISFRDPEPDKSRMEALSKLGLDKQRATSFHTTDGTSQDLPKVDTKAKTAEPSVAPATQRVFSAPEPNALIPPPSYFHSDKKTEILSTYPPKGQAERSFREKPSSPTTANLSPPPSEVTNLEFNNYGGKSIAVHPSFSSKNEPITQPTSPEPKNLPPTLSYPAELNPYGGKTKVIVPASAPTTRTNLPDILSSHIDKSHPAPAKLEPQLAELNSSGGKSWSINPIQQVKSPPSSSVKIPKFPPPATAPRPHRNTHQGINTPPKSPAQALSSDHSSKPSSMFRPQGITVQFCGLGPMNDSRREALRKLGLFKD